MGSIKGNIGLMPLSGRCLEILDTSDHSYLTIELAEIHYSCGFQVHLIPFHELDRSLSWSYCDVSVLNTFSANWCKQTSINRGLRLRNSPTGDLT